MRIIVFSDTHQNTALLRRAALQAIADGPVDILIHCGDGVRDLDCIEGDLLRANPNIRIYAVRGNCDLGMSQYPLTEIVALQDRKILVTHGHALQVKHSLGALAKAAGEVGADIACFGHTHQPLIREKHGVTLINPGSLASYSLTDTAYLEIMIDSHSNIRENFIKRSIK